MKLIRLLMVFAGIVLFAYLAGPAIDHEFRGRSVAAHAAPGNLPTTHQGKGVLWWSKRAVQARKDANARGRTIRRLKRELHQGIVPWYWFAIGSCESGLRWSYNGGSGFDGALQFHPGTWNAYRPRSYPYRAYLASPFQQLVVAELVLASQGWRAWPACSRKLGLR